MEPAILRFHRFIKKEINLSIEVQNLTKIYGSQRAIDHISFAASVGEVLGFLGPNGAGKSTTMKILTCFIPQDDGEARVCGFDVTSDSMEVRRRIGYLPEHNPLYPEMYVAEYLKFVAGLHKIKGKKARLRIEEMIEKTGLIQERKKKIEQLSKGFKQRVGLAQALFHDPQVLILDEPTSGLDPNQLAEIRKLIIELGKEKTVLLSSHIMQEVQAVCDRVVILDKGKIVADDKTEKLQQGHVSTQAIIVEFKEDIVEENWNEIDGIVAIARDGNTWKLNAQSDIREKVFQFALSKNLTLLTLQLDKHSLEDVFKQVTN